MTNKIVVAGGTGNLGGRILRALSRRSANVVVLMRRTESGEKRKALDGLGVEIRDVDTMSVSDLSTACSGATCVVSALQGLHEVIVDTQAVLLKAAIAAGVDRFIPSDFATDFRTLSPGENRNYDFRRESHQQLDVAEIKSTSIFNGVFAEILVVQKVPYLDFDKKQVGYWGSPD